MTDQPIIVCSTSGGKDSLATSLIAKQKHGGRCRFVLADTGNEHEILLEYVYDYLPTIGIEVDTVRADFTDRIAGKRHYVETKWPEKGVPQEVIDRALSVLHPTGVPFLDLCLWKGRFPARMSQFCTFELKRRPLDAYMLDLMAAGYAVENWQGIRRDESDNRKDALKAEMTAEGWMIRRPIVHWTAEMVVKFVQRCGVELCPLYSLGCGRVGCMLCINSGKDEIDNAAKRWPEHIDKLREWERLVCLAAKRGWTTFFCDSAQVSETPLPGWIYKPLVDKDTGETKPLWVEPDEEIYARLNIDARVEWAMTTRGGRQYDLLKAAPPLACSSSYGLCE